MLYSVTEALLTPGDQVVDIAELVNYGRDSKRLDSIAGPMTGRSAHKLTRFYGYISVRDLCADLPDGAKVFDAGAGLSNLGHRAAATRPDVTWTNLDVRYSLSELPDDDRLMLTARQSVAPPNLSYIGVNMLDLPPSLYERPFDCGFSYYMLPHIIDNYGLELSRTVLENVLKLIKSGGQFHTGPNRYTDDAWSVTVPDHSDTGALAAEMVEDYTKL